MTKESREGTLSDVAGAQSYTRSRSLNGMKKSELIERVLLVEKHCRFIDAQLHEAWRENRHLREIAGYQAEMDFDKAWRRPGI